MRWVVVIVCCVVHGLLTRDQGWRAAVCWVLGYAGGAFFVGMGQ